MSEIKAPSFPSKVIIAAGTYDGVLAGWELFAAKKKLVIAFASPVHGGSIRALTMAGTASSNNNSTTTDKLMPGSLLSCGYDEMLRTHDFSKRLTSSGEVRTPNDFGTPICSSFAPPGGQTQLPSTHCILGFSGGKIVIYKKRDWVVQHVLAGHDGGVSALAVHPSGKLALSGGISDGKLKLWDLTKGRLAFVTKIKPATTSVQGRTHYDSVVSIVWSPDEEGLAYSFAYGSHITVREVASGKDLLDVELPSKVNQLCLMEGPEGMFAAAACNDGSLPVLAVQKIGSEEIERRAIMAIEPVDGPVAGEERFKCIQSVSGYYVATANSAGVVSLMNLQGAVNMIMSPENNNETTEETPVDSDSDDDEDKEGEEELAVDIIDSIRLGSGARITCLAAWCSHAEIPEEESDDEMEKEEAEEVKEEKKSTKEPMKKTDGRKEVVMDAKSLEKARALVSKAKKIQKRKSKQKHKIGGRR